MPIRCSGFFPVYLLTLSVAFCLKDDFREDKTEEAKQPLNMQADTYDKDADDIASFKELIGEARQVFQESEDVCNNHNDHNGQHNLKLVAGSSSKSVATSSASASSIVLLGDIFEVRDVVPDHAKFTDKLSWVQFTSDSYRMDLLLTAKDRPFQILRNDKFAVTFREDNKFNQGLPGLFKAGSFDHIMNGTLYKTLISDSSVHPTKTLDILYVSFGDSFLKLRANAGEFRYFKNCKQLYILFQKLAFR